MVVDGVGRGYEGGDGRGETQQEEQVYVSVNVLPTELLPGGQIGIMTTARGAAAARWGGERKGRSGRGNRAVGDRSQIKADDTVSALKARQLGTLTWDSHPARRRKIDSPCADPPCDTSMLVDGPLPYPCWWFCRGLPTASSGKGNPGGGPKAMGWDPNPSTPGGAGNRPFGIA